MSEALKEIDDILSNMNISWIGEDIRKRLEKAGYIICKMPGGVHRRYCPTCGCEPQHGYSE
jgi:hypothetical protein